MVVLLCRRLVASLPEMEPKHWARFSLGGPEVLLYRRAFWLAHAETFDNEFYVASLWNTAGDRVRGLAICMVDLVSARRPMMTVNGYCHSLCIMAGDDPEEVVQALLQGLLTECHRLGLAGLSLSYYRADAHDVLRVAQRLGGRALPSIPHHEILLQQASDLDAYLNSLGSKRRNDFRHDLHRAARMGATLFEEHPASHNALERAWVLQEALYLRKGTPYKMTGRNLFAGFSRHMPPDCMVLTRCVREAEELGFALSFRTGAITDIAFVGHGPTPGAYLTVFAAAIQSEIRRGARRLLLGYTTDAYKKRLGAVPVPLVHCLLPTAR